jgi:hypothetical protein
VLLSEKSLITPGPIKRNQQQEINILNIEPVIVLRLGQSQKANCSFPASEVSRETEFQQMEQPLPTSFN